MNTTDNTKTKSNVLKKVIAIIISIVAVASIGVICYAAANKNSDTNTSETAYREYSISKGNITVGLSESGTISLDRSNITFPVSAEIEEVYIDVGSDIVKGDKLAKLKVDDISTLKTQYEQKISDAKLSLENAEINAEEKRFNAKQTYDSSLSKASSADTSYNMSITQLERNITSAEKNITNSQNELTEMQELKETYPSDYAVLTKYEDTLSSYNTTYKGYQDTYSGYEKTLKEYQKELSNKQTALSDYKKSIWVLL